MMIIIMIKVMIMMRLFIKSLQNSMMPSGEKSRVGSSVVVEQVLADGDDADEEEYGTDHTYGYNKR